MPIFNSYVSLPEGNPFIFGKLILTSLSVWDYLRSPAKNFVLGRVSMIGNDRSNHPECGCFSNCYPIREFHMNNEQYLGWFLDETPKWLATRRKTSQAANSKSLPFVGDINIQETATHQKTNPMFFRTSGSFNAQQAEKPT